MPEDLRAQGDVGLGWPGLRAVGVQGVDQQTVLGQSAHGAKATGLPSLGPTPFALLEWGTSAPPTLGMGRLSWGLQVWG